MEISVRELKNHLSKYLHLVQEGKPLVITSHRKRLVQILAFPSHNKQEYGDILQIPGIQWNGKKPQVHSGGPVITGKNAAENIIEDRR